MYLIRGAHLPIRLKPPVLAWKHRKSKNFTQPLSVCKLSWSNRMLFNQGLLCYFPVLSTRNVDGRVNTVIQAGFPMPGEGIGSACSNTGFLRASANLASLLKFDRSFGAHGLLGEAYRTFHQVFLESFLTLISLIWEDRKRFLQLVTRFRLVFFK